METESHPDDARLPWVRACVIEPWIIWMSNNKYNLGEELRKVDLSHVLRLSGDELISKWCVMRLITNLSNAKGPGSPKVNGPGLPILVMDDDDAFKPVSELLLPGALSVKGALQRSVKAVQSNFSHLEMSADFGRSGDFQVRGSILKGCHCNMAHLVQLYIAAIIRRLCKESLSRDQSVFTRVELSQHSGGNKHLTGPDFDNVVERKDLTFVVSVRRSVANSVYPRCWWSGVPRPLAGYRTPCHDDCSSAILAVGEEMDGPVTIARIAASASCEPCTIMRSLKDCYLSKEELLGALELNRNQKKRGGVGEWNVYPKNCLLNPTVFHFRRGQVIAAAKAAARQKA